MNFQNAQLSAVSIQIFNSFFNRFGAGTHNYDNIFGIFSANIVNNMILAAADFCKFIHFFLNNAFNIIIINVSSFTTLEEYIRILCGTADNRIFRAQSMLGIKFIINVFQHCAQIVVGQQFNFFNFMRSSETIKKM